GLESVRTPRKAIVSSPGGGPSRPITILGRTTATPPVHGSSRSQTPSPSPSTGWQVAEQQWSLPFPAPSSQVSPHSAWTTPSPQLVDAPAQTPAAQWSPGVQAVPSSQAVPSGRAGFEHVPVAGLQVPTAWHGSSAVQTIGFVPVQVPPVQVSVCVHASASSQAVPSGRVGWEQTPVCESHVP